MLEYLKPRNDAGITADQHRLSKSVSDIESAARTFTEGGGVLERGLQGDIAQMRNSMPGLIKHAARYRTCAPTAFISHKSAKTADDAMAAFRSSTVVLHLQLATAYEALPDEAKALVPNPEEFERLIGNKQVYEAQSQR